MQNEMKSEWKGSCSDCRFRMGKNSRYYCSHELQERGSGLRISKDEIKKGLIGECIRFKEEVNNAE